MLKFSKSRSDFKVKFTRSKIMVPCERPCHKGYTCAIRKLYCFWFESYSHGKTLIKRRSNFKVKVTRSKIIVPYWSHLSGNISTMNPSTDTIGWPSCSVPFFLRLLILSSAPFSPLVYPTGWAAVLAWLSYKTWMSGKTYKFKEGSK